MPSSDRDLRPVYAVSQPLLLLVASPAALEEAGPLGGPLVLQVLAEQLLEELGSCSPDTEAGATAAASIAGTKAISWLCDLQTKYYTANIRALLLQLQEPAQTQKPQPLLQEPPEAVVFICSTDEHHDLYEARRRALAKAAAQADGEPEVFLEPLPFMKGNFVVQHQHQQKEQSSSGVSDWWVRRVPLKFIVSLHCNPNGRRCSGGCSGNLSITSAASEDDVETVVWNIGGDVFLEGLEVCLVGTRTAEHATAADWAGAPAAASAVAQQRHRLQKLAQALHCHMWPGLSRISTKTNGNSSRTKSSRTNNIHDGDSEMTRPCNAVGVGGSAAGERRHCVTQDMRVFQSGRRESEGLQAEEKDEGVTAPDDVEAFDALAAAMLDLKQRGPSVASEGRRHAAMRLAAQIAALTMCDEE